MTNAAFERRRNTALWSPAATAERPKRNPETRLSARVLYINPAVAEGDAVSAGDVLGAAQDLTGRYPGITNHVHVEMRDAQRRLIDVSGQLPSAPMLEARTQGDAISS